MSDFPVVEPPDTRHVRFIPDPDGFSIDKDWNINTSLKFHIAATSKVDAYNKLALEKQITIGTPYTDYLGNQPNTNIVCQGLNIKPEGEEFVNASARWVSGMWTGGWYIAECTYGLRESVKPKRMGVNGLTLWPGGPAIWYTEQGIENVPVDLDRDGDPITNSAGVPIDGVQAPMTTEFVCAEWILENAKWIDWVKKSRQFIGHLNEKKWCSADPETLLCHGLAPEALDWDAFGAGGGVKLKLRLEWKKSQTILVDGKPVTAPGFRQVFPNTGLVEKNPDFDAKAKRGEKNSNLYRPILMADPSDVSKMVQVTEPVYLDKEGHADPNNKMNVVQWDTIPTADFEDIGVPGTKEGVPQIAGVIFPVYVTVQH